jgi:ketosteroid isomerase-like protein
MAGEEAVRTVKAAFSVGFGDWSEGLRLLADDLVLLSSSGRLYLGPDGMVRWYQDTIREVEETGLASGRYSAISNEWVLVRGDVASKLRSGREQRQPTTWIVRVLDGKIAAGLCYRIEADAIAAINSLGDVPGRDELTGSFVMRSLSGRLAVRQAGGAGPPGRTDHLVERIENGNLEKVGDGYGVLRPAGESGAWLLMSKNGRLGAAFEFPDLTTAKAALPISIYQPTAVELVESALYAFAAGDSTRILPLLAPDFTYTDRAAGIELQGAVTVLTGLLLAQERVMETGLPALEVTDQRDGTARVSGLIVDPDAPDTGNRWVTVLGVDAGRLKWAERQPNEPGPS